MRSRADALSGVVRVVGDKAVLATKVAWLFDVTERLAVLRVVALLLSGLGIDLIAGSVRDHNCNDKLTYQVGEEVVGTVSAEQVGDTLTNGVVEAEIGEDRQAETQVEVTGDQRLA